MCVAANFRFQILHGGLQNESVKLDEARLKSGRPRQRPGRAYEACGSAQQEQESRSSSNSGGRRRRRSTGSSSSSISGGGICGGSRR